MDKHYGQIVELIIRKKGYSISELARLSYVNRRSVYNWFNQKYLKPEIIYRIGCKNLLPAFRVSPLLLLFGKINTLNCWRGIITC